MNKTYFLLIALCFFATTKAQIVNIPDANLKTALLNHIPTIDINSNRQIEYSEASSVVGELLLNNKSISNISGIEAFINVKKINLANNKLSSTITTPLLFNSLLSLEELDLTNNYQISAINCDQIVPLKYIYIDRYVSAFFLNAQSQLIDLKCNSDIFKSISNFNKAQIKKLNIYISEMDYTQLALGTLTNLIELYVDGNDNGIYLEFLTGSLPNLNKITFNNITLLSTFDTSIINSVEEFIFQGGGYYGVVLYNKIFALSNLKRLTLHNSRTGTNFPNNHLDFSNNLNLEYLKLDFDASTASYLPLIVSNNLNLKYLELSGYSSNSIFLNNNTQLETLIIGSLFKDAIDLTNNKKLKKLFFTSFSSTFDAPYTLNLSQNGLLEDVTIRDYRMNNINFGDLKAIRNLKISGSKLATIDLTSFSNLVDFYLSSNTDILEIDLNNCLKLNTVYIELAIVSGSNLYPINFYKLKNGSTESSVVINKGSYSNLCIDENDAINKWLINNSYSSQNNKYSTYCNFTPGGFYNTISGKIRLDLDSNGCDANDSTVNNIKVEINDLKESGYTFTNSNGDYEFFTKSNNIIITPYPNVNYFIPSPQSANINFNNQVQQQDFCVVANGSHPDLEITLLPLLPAVPGFDAKYKIVYRNNGNTVQSGVVNLNFNDAVLDLVEANPTTTTQTLNNLSWDFTNLLPFETREITFTLNLNSPMETPALIGGAILAYNATITSAATDETPIDNTFAFNQIVVNSFDPNDKTCLEGSTISPSLIGQYVHYMIRFENSGTANARNIVVKDMIDLSKFDISTLVPTNGSHSFVTNITAGNKVEFIFENINLPFDDANNDGYIAFKIKTLPTLKVGDTFTNDASIYFDYNFPIVTKLASSTFKTLGTQDFDFTRYFTVYPNPAKADLNITARESINVKSISVYNTLGQLVFVVTNAEKTANIDVSSLKSGNYFIKIKTDKGTSNARFVKD
jgi:hypothetical protein